MVLFKTKPRFRPVSPRNMLDAGQDRPSPQSCRADSPSKGEGLNTSKQESVVVKHEQTDASTIPPPHPSEGTEDSQQSSKEADAHDQPSSIDEKDGDGTGADPDLADVPDHAEYVRRLFAKGSSLGPRNLLLGTVSAKPKLSAYEDFLRYGATHTVEEIAAAFQTHNPATAAKAGHSRQLRKRISNRYSECKDRIASHRNMGTSKRLLVEGFHKAKIRNGVTLRKDLLAGQRRMAKEGEESSGATPKGEDSSGATPKADSSSERS